MSIILCRAQSALKAAQGNLEQAVVYCMDPASIPSSPEQQQAAAESQNVNVMILGATGPQAQVVNGIFKPTPTLQNGHPLYRKQEDGKEDVWLRYGKDKKWWVCLTRSKDKNALEPQGIALSKDSNLGSPTQAKMWEVKSKQEAKECKLSSLRQMLTIFSSKEIPGSGASRGTAADVKDKQTSQKDQSQGEGEGTPLRKLLDMGFDEATAKVYPRSHCFSASFRSPLFIMHCISISSHVVCSLSVSFLHRTPFELQLETWRELRATAWIQAACHRAPPLTSAPCLR